MRRAFVLSLLVGLQLVSVSAVGEESAKAATDRVIALCEFSNVAARSIGAKLQVRGKMTLHAHGVLLSDDKCPNVRVHLKETSGGPDISLCNSPELVRRFGCPAGGDAGPVVTAIGVLRETTEPENGFLLVEELVDLESTIDADVR